MLIVQMFCHLLINSLQFCFFIFLNPVSLSSPLLGEYLRHGEAQCKTVDRFDCV